MAKNKNLEDVELSTMTKNNKLEEIELFPITNNLPTFETSDTDKDFSPEVAEKGSSLKQGFPISLSLKWVLSVHGIEYIQLYLWFIKDWSWCTMRWVYVGIISGSLAMIWSILLLFLSLGAHLYGEAFLAVGMICWLSAQFIWMIGEFWNENFLDDGEDFYQACLKTARGFAASSSLILLFYFLILLPSGFFDWERRTNKLALRLSHDAPPPRFPSIFKTFREYETLHLLFWAIKDMCWIFDLPEYYAIGYIPTLILNVDLLYLYATHLNQYIDFWHCFLCFIWVLSNGVWAYGEMEDENPNDGINISDEDWDAFNWPSFPDNLYFQDRYIACWIFCLGPVIMFSFYLHWVYITMYRPPLEELLVEWRDQSEQFPINALTDSSSKDVELSIHKTVRFTSFTELQLNSSSSDLDDGKTTDLDEVSSLSSKKTSKVMAM